MTGASWRGITPGVSAGSEELGSWGAVSSSVAELTPDLASQQRQTRTEAAILPFLYLSYNKKAKPWTFPARKRQLCLEKCLPFPVASGGHLQNSRFQGPGFPGRALRVVRGVEELCPTAARLVPPPRWDVTEITAPRGGGQKGAHA